MNSKILWLVILLAILGIFDTTYLTAEHYLGSPVYCPIGGECEEGLSSPYSTIYGIPLALFGAAFYFFTLVLALIYQLNANRFLLKLFFISSFFAFIFSGWLVYLQLFVIKAICIYCVISAVNVTILFVISVYLLKLTKDEIQ